jgi:multicomponent Na+:H+ antiporter subunit D
LSVQALATPIADWIVVLPVLLGLAGGALLLVLRPIVQVQRWICLAALLAILVCDWVLLQRVLAGGPLAMTMGHWLPPFGITFAADAFGAGFALVATLISLSVWLSMQFDTPESAVRDGVYPLMLLLLAGVSGAVLTGDLFNLYVWFEVMLIASFGLMSLAGNPLQLDGAVKYGILNLVGTMLFLAGLGLFYGLVGTLNMADIVGAAQRADPPALASVAALLALAFALKAAVFPVGAWLPASYHAPPAAISALVGALLTKVGVYALLRTLVMLVPETAAVLAPTLTVLAVATMIIGPLGALAETNLRRAVGFLLIGGVGVAISALAQPDEIALSGALAYVLHAMLGIGALYLVAGLVERATGAFRTDGMGGLYAASPALAALFFVLVLAIAGVPPFLGFWPKLLLLQSYLAAGNWLLVFAVLLNALLTLIAGARLWSRIFWHPASGPLTKPQGRGGAVLLVGTIVVLGFAPGLLIQIGQAGAGTMVDPSRYIAAVGLSP